MLGSWRPRGDATLYARAIPRKVELTESYSVEQEISRSPAIHQAGDGTGRIEVSIPYDGCEYFGRQAVADVESVLGHRASWGERQATIGHLMLTDHTQTTGLREVMRPHNQVGLIPLNVSVATRDGNLDVIDDRHESVIGYDYQPDGPDINPIELVVGLADPDSLTRELDAFQSLATRGRENPSLVIEKLRQKASFSSELLLRIVVRISIPVKGGYPSLEPLVKRMSVQWPTLTSLRSTKLYVVNRDPLSARSEPVRYNPVKGRLEWRNVEMFLVPSGESEDDAGTRMYQSAAVLLTIGHPGELFKEDTLELNARVEIPRYLLSGVEARLFDATGRGQVTEPDMTTKVNIRTVVYPADIFASRVFSPYQQFVFDGIVPDEMRITDIVNVLSNAGFTVEKLRPQGERDPVAPTWLLLGRRSQGPDELVLLVAVEGKRDIVGRERIHGTDIKVTESAETGQLKISVLGTLPRDHKELTREMNALQQALRERFRFYQSGGKGTEL